MSLPPTLYRFGKKQYLESFVTEGIISFAPACMFTDSLLMEAQRDNEQERSASPSPGRHQIHVVPPGGTSQPITNVFNIQITYELMDVDGNPLKYYLACFSLVADPSFYDAFQADCYVEVRDPAEFLRRLNRAVQEQLPEWGGRALPVSYYPTDALIEVTDTLSLIFMKDASYQAQQEFRLLLLGPLDQMDDQRRTLTLGNLSDICNLHHR